MGKSKINPGTIKRQEALVVNAASPKPPTWKFSFQYWKQKPDFGFDSGLIQADWFVSLLDQLHSLSALKIEDIRGGRDSGMRTGLRYHEINWAQPGIPLQRTDFDWLPLNYRENDRDFPFYQFQISLGKGRVIGFWDEDDTFQILLLDPLHNMQPSKKYNYKVDPCAPLRNEHEKLQYQMDMLRMRIGKECLNNSCKISSYIHELAPTTEVIIAVAEMHWQSASQLISDGKIRSIDELFEIAILLDLEDPELFKKLNS